MPQRKPILISNKTLNLVKAQAKGERKTFSAPASCFIPPPAPQRRPTVPILEPPPLSLSPASPDTNIGVHIKRKKKERSLNDYVAYSCPAYAPNFLDIGSPEELDEDGKDIDGTGKKATHLTSIAEKPVLGSSPTIISLLHTERLSVPKGEGRRSSLSSTSSRSTTQSLKSNQDFDLFELEQNLPSGGAPDDLQFEMETGTESQGEGETGECLPSFT